MDDVMLMAVTAAQENPFPKPGDLVTGIVLDRSKNRCLVDLCQGQAVGIISGRETHDSAGTYKTVEKGDEIQAVVVEDENDEGFFVLSLRKAAQNTAWDRFEKMYNEGKVFDVKVDEANKGGLLLEIDSIKGFLPVSQLAPMHYPRVNEANSQEILRRLQNLIGEKFRVKIISIDRENGKLILSERAAEEEGRSDRLHKLKAGDVVKGKISGIVKFGLFVAFDGLEGLVHISEIAWGHVRNPSDYGKLGDPVEVMVIGMEGEKISLSVKRLQADPWQEAAKKYDMGAKVKGKVNRLTTFGAFVTLEDEINGLIHLSEISHEKIDDIDKVLKVGQEIEAEVIKLDLKDHRIGLSMKKLLPVPPGMENMDEEMNNAPGAFGDVMKKDDMGKDDKDDKDDKEEALPGDDLTSVDGVSEKIAGSLTAAGIDTVEKLKAAKIADLESLDGVGPKTAEKILESVKEL
ncbi:MAG: S1 RNA-binding domain-containing protein [bacterium]|nr:S1 RNA-binding domain-containing protein [bacterium]